MSIHLQNQINELKRRVEVLEAQVLNAEPVVPSRYPAPLSLTSPHDAAARKIIDSKRRLMTDDTE